MKTVFAILGVILGSALVAWATTLPPIVVQPGDIQPVQAATPAPTPTPGPPTVTISPLSGAGVVGITCSDSAPGSWVVVSVTGQMPPYTLASNIGAVWQVTAGSYTANCVGHHLQGGVDTVDGTQSAPVVATAPPLSMHAVAGKPMKR